MLSILIPIYNYDVRAFVTELYRQSSGKDFAFEIRCYDDHSAEHFRDMNREIKQIKNLEYIELPENKGRSAIRNLLARDAIYPYLLFLDCDSIPEHDDFIEQYIKQLTPDSIVYGGRTYEAAPPEKHELFLRWYYGSQREVLSPEQRNKKPYHSFQTNNFVIPRELFLSIGLNENLTGYGHEDTQFGQHLEEKNIRIIHIDNPLKHLGLEDSEEFLAKTTEGLSNLLYLIDHDCDVSNIRLARFYFRIKKWGLSRLVVWFFNMREKAVISKLHSPKVKLKTFDFFKLGKLLQLDAQRKLR